MAKSTTNNRKRAALIINPYSSGMTAAREVKIVQELRKTMDVIVRRTERAGHAPQLAAELISQNSIDVLIACGGDGTANEILNGLSLHESSADTLPIFAIIPAGGTNVLARSLGYPNHPVRALKRLIQNINTQEVKAITLGKVDERVFMFSAGIGFDGEVIKRMEERRSGRRPSDFATIASIVGIYAKERFAFEPTMKITVDDTNETIEGSMVMVGNTTPLTYVGRLPVHMMPDADLELGLDFIAPQRANAGFAMLNGAQGLGIGRKNKRLVSGDKLQLHHDVSALTVECDEPQPVQADGEYLGLRTLIRFTTIKKAIKLVV